MAKYHDTKPRVPDKTKYLEVEINSEMKTSFIAYAMAVNVSRAIPDVRDGLKPVHRRILYSMNELGLTSDKPTRKCARIVGDVLGKYHPHGDSSVYEALARLAQDFSTNEPFVDGQGNFGSVDGDKPAAMRYTEARLSKIASEMLRDIDKDTVDWRGNFDETLQEPVVLPSRIPNLLVNGSDGIAVGMATSIPPHNLGEVIDGAVALIDDPEISIDDLMKIVPAPDFPTGALIMGRQNIRCAYRTGRGAVLMRARADIQEYATKDDGSGGTRQRIVITEIPYQVNKSQLIKSISELYKDKKVEGIADLRDESDRNGMRIVIELKRDAQPQVVLNLLYKHTALQTSMGIIFLALVNGEPKVLNLKEMLYYYLEHQKDVIVRRTKYDLEKAKEREHIVEGLVKALANIDDVVQIIRSSKDRYEASERLTEALYLTDKQASAILDMRLARLTSLEVQQLENELVELKNKIEELSSILENPEKVLAIIKEEILEIKEKYATPRKTELCIDYDEIDIGDLIEKEDVVVSMTHFGYIKRLPQTEYRTQHRGGKGITAHKPKEEDFVENLFIANTHDDLMFFTNFGKVYCIKTYEIPEAERTARGRNIVNLLQLSEGEKVTAIIPKKEDSRGSIVMATKNALIKKTALSEFDSIRRGGKIAISLNEGDELINVAFTGGRDEILIASSSGKCIRFSEEDVRQMGRNAMGVRAMRLSGDERLVDMTVVTSNCQVVTVSSLGYGKRSDIDEYRLQSRGGKGIKAGVFNEKTGSLVNLKLVDPGDDIMIIADNGTIIRMKASEISKISRDTRGVRMMRMKGQGEVVCVCKAQPYEEEEDGEGESE